MPVATLVGTPDPDEDLHRRVEALERTLAGELQRLIRSLQTNDVSGDLTYRVNSIAEALNLLETNLSDLIRVVEHLRDSFTGHVHHSAPQITGGVV